MLDENSMEELICAFENEKKIYTSEGDTGVQNLCRLVRAIGYEDPMFYGQFDYGVAYGDLFEFLRDNSGCIEAIKRWIGEQNVREWKDNLLSEIPVEDDDEEDEDEMPTTDLVNDTRLD